MIQKYHFMFVVWFLVALLMNVEGAKEVTRRVLAGDWTVAVVKATSAPPGVLNTQYPTTVPSTIHLVLQKAKVIPDPYLDDNINGVHWLSQSTVLYRTVFAISASNLTHTTIQLEFAGIDTYATIRLNDHVLGKTNNAFHPFIYSIKNMLKEGSNALEVEIESTKAYDDAGQRTNRMPFDYAHTRKACYQYSWDWAPYMNTLGIWRPVSLLFFDQVAIDYVWVQNAALEESLAQISFLIYLKTPLSTIEAGCTVLVSEPSTSQQITANVKSNPVALTVSINNPILWWPNGIGSPHLYEFKVQLQQNGVALDERKIPYGIKTVKLNEENKQFTIYVNGYPVYCKGANYVPMDMMYPRTVNREFASPKSHEQLLNEAVQSNFNMLRVWGGGQYESDQFYELAARKGIMIFHDFMFSDSIYPSNSQFLETVTLEVVYQIRRIRNWACLVLWSGNNEILQGIQSWGWGSLQYQKDYKQLFEVTIRALVKAQSPYIPYIPSSPSLGVGNYGFDRGGDVHFWGVWAGGSPFESYRTAVGGFNSEFGTQSLPVWQTILQFTSRASDRNYGSREVAFHEKHGSGFSTLRSYMNMYAHPSLDFERQTYSSGLVQAYGLQIALIAQKLAKPKSWGTLYWQYNDAWPAISWAAVDYYGRWKPLQYLAKRLYAPVVILPDILNVYILSDLLYTHKVFALAELLSFQGVSLQKVQIIVQVANNSRALLLKLDQNTFVNSKNTTLLHTIVTFGAQKEQTVENTFFFVPYKQMILPNTELIVTYGSNSISFSARALIKSLHIYNSLKYIRLSDNYFDVVPGYPRTITFPDKENLADLIPTMKYRSYRQVYTQEQLRVIVN